MKAETKPAPDLPDDERAQALADRAEANRLADEVWALFAERREETRQ